MHHDQAGEQRLRITLEFTAFGTPEQAVQTGQRLQRMLALELSRPVLLLELEVGESGTGRATSTGTDGAGQRAVDGGAAGAVDAAAGHRAGAGGGAVY